MRIVRYKAIDGAAYGAVEDGAVYELLGDPYGDRSIGQRVASLEDVRILLPCLPTKIVAVGRNYRSRVREVRIDVPEEPLIFLKPPSTVIPHLDAIVYPTALTQRVDHEGELAVVIGRRCRNADVAQARAAILGYTCANDVTARDLQRKDGQWTRGKGFDTFLPLGPFVQTDIDWRGLTLQTRLNGLVRQSAQLSELIFPVDYLVSFVSQIMTLLPGDVILTGSPSGSGPMQTGDVVEVDITGVGTLRNHVVASRH